MKVQEYQFVDVPWDDRTKPWFNIEPGTVVYQDYGHNNECVQKITRELVPKLEQFLFQPATPAVIVQMQATVDAYFANQWFVNKGCNINVEIDPDTGGVNVIAVINYGDDSTDSDLTDSVITDSDINFEVDYFIDYTVGMDIDEALEATLDPPDETTQKDKGSSADDVLFEPVDLEAERKPKPEPVYDDYGAYVC